MKMRPNKKNMCVFSITGLKILGSTFFFLYFFFMKKKGMHFERHFTFQNAKKKKFPRKPEKNLGFTSKFR